MVSAVAGIAAVVLGGLAAAVSGPLAWQRGPWVAAFLVLVTGVSQTAFGTSRAVLGAASLRMGAVVLRAVLWNGGSSVVLLGTVAGAPSAVAVGSLLLALGVGCYASDLRTAPRPRLWWAYLALLVIVGGSIPVGVVLSIDRA
jgi:hypothetical protein